MESQTSKLRSAFGRFMRGMSDLLILNLLTLLSSLLIITIGPALCALYTNTLKIARDEPVEPIRGFFSAFGKNFVRGVLFGLIALFGAIVIYADVTFAIEVTGTAKTVFGIISGIVAAIWLTYVCYIFALQARFENSVKNQIRNALLLAFLFPGKTVLMWIILAIPVALILFLPQNVVVYIGFIFILFGISLPVFCCSIILRGIFDRFDPADPEEQEEEADDLPPINL